LLPKDASLGRDEDRKERFKWQLKAKRGLVASLKSVQKAAKTILSQEMGTTMRKKIKFLLCSHQQEELYEGRVSRTVLTKHARDKLLEGWGAIPLHHPINKHCKPSFNKKTN